MDRCGRLSLAVVAIAVVATAGCSSFPIGSDPAGTTQAPTEPWTETPPPEGNTDTPIEGGPHTVPANQRLVLGKAIEGNVTVSLYAEAETPIPTDTPAETVRRDGAASVTYGPEERGEIAVTEFEVDGYVVVSLDDEVIWQRWVEPYEHVELRIDHDGDAETVDYFVL